MGTAAVRLSLLGVVGAEAEGRWLALAGAQPRLVLALLVERHGRPVTSAELAEALWPGHLTPHWEGAVRGVIAKVRAFLHELGPDAAVIENVGHTYRLACPPGCEVDVWSATRALGEADAAVASGAHLDAARFADHAAEALGAGLLPGADGPWLDSWRAALESQHRRALLVAATAWFWAGDFDEAACRARRLVDDDPYDEAGWRALIAADLAAGDRSAALRAYARCRHVLADDLGVTPSPATEELHDQTVGRHVAGEHHQRCQRITSSLQAAGRIVARMSDLHTAPATPATPTSPAQRRAPHTSSHRVTPPTDPPADLVFRSDDRLMVIVAHPDDETFGCGSLIATAASLGVPVAVVCATRGEAGEATGAVDLTTRTLGEVRADELHDAARRLGVGTVHLLDFADSGFDGPCAAGSLCGTSITAVAAALRPLLREFSPTVVLTLDGCDGHRDHLHVLAAVETAMRDVDATLYCSTLPNHVMRRWLDEQQATRGDGAYHGIDRDLFGSPDDAVTHRLDVRPVLTTRLEAIAMHRSQHSPFDGLSIELRDLLLCTDHLIRKR